MIRGAILALLISAALALPAEARTVRYLDFVCVELTAVPPGDDIPDEHPQAELARRLETATFAAEVRVVSGPAWQTLSVELCGTGDTACVPNPGRGAGRVPTVWRTVRPLQDRPAATRITLAPETYESQRFGLLDAREAWMQGASCAQGFRTHETDALAIERAAPFILVVGRDHRAVLFWARDPAVFEAVR